MRFMVACSFKKLGLPVKYGWLLKTSSPRPENVIPAKAGTYSTLQTSRT
ncbi:MAG: hypothetical protein M3Y65_00820 [Pseudomonadota bacterium]|nr:hypothetical protein [Pseudomonadota bacterium]